MLQRFYGPHTLYFNNVKMYFVIMNNVFVTNLKAYYKYDLKVQLTKDSRNGTSYDNYGYGIPLKD
jgi:hypothetical protein